jgi:N-acetylglucosamine kinase-like BadF-type ATPase
MMIAIGIDAGGTATVAAVSRNGTAVREASGPAANATTAGVAASAATIVATMRAALGIDEPDSVHAGVAGAGRPEVARELKAAIARAFPAARVVVSDDASIALRGAIASGPGVILIAGTGSVAYAEHADGSVLVGGHGHLLGDEGSAFAVGMAAVRLYSRVLDGRAAPDETSDLVARALRAPDRAALHTAIYDRQLDPAAIAALAPSIVAFAGKGNRTSTKIVQDAARDLGDLINAALRLAKLTGASPPIALAGGLLRENSLLTFLLETRITGDFTGSEIVRGGFEPVRGALRLAEAAGAPA